MKLLQWRRISIMGAGAMFVDWAPGVGVAIAGSFFSFWRATGVAQARGEERMANLKKEIARVEHGNKELAGVVHDGLQQTFKQMGEMLTQMKVSAAEQSAFNQVCTKTLDSILKKMESQGFMLQQHETAITVVKNDLDKRVKA